MSVLLIIYKRDIENPNVLNDRIKALGNTFYAYENVVFLETKLSTKEVYERISKNEYEKCSMLVMYVTNEDLGFWGRMNTQLWKWLEEKEASAGNNGLVSNYIDEFTKVNAVNKILLRENTKLREELEEKTKVIDNLYSQVLSYEKKVKEE